MQITPQWAKALENIVLNMETIWRQILRADRSADVNTDFKLHLEAPWTASPVLGVCSAGGVTSCGGVTYYSFC